MATDTSHRLYDIFVLILKWLWSFRLLHWPISIPIVLPLEPLVRTISVLMSFLTTPMTFDIRIWVSGPDCTGYRRQLVQFHLLAFSFLRQTGRVRLFSFPFRFALGFSTIQGLLFRFTDELSCTSLIIAVVIIFIRVGFGCFIAGRGIVGSIILLLLFV